MTCSTAVVKGRYVFFKNYNGKLLGLTDFKGLSLGISAQDSLCFSKLSVWCLYIYLYGLFAWVFSCVFHRHIHCELISIAAAYSTWLFQIVLVFKSSIGQTISEWIYHLVPCKSLKISVAHIYVFLIVIFFIITKIRIRWII